MAGAADATDPLPVLAVDGGAPLVLAGGVEGAAGWPMTSRYPVLFFTRMGLPSGWSWADQIYMLAFLL